MTVKKPLYQSASRNEKYQECTMRYAARYVYKLPDTTNDGASRGNVCHDTLELLLKPRHKPLFDTAIEAGTCTEVPALWRLLVKNARKYGVADEENLEAIDGFMMVALRNEFYGPAGTIESFAEREFSLEVDEPDGRRYNLRGFIDQTFIVKDGDGLLVDVRDFKSSKAKFKGDKETFNIQSVIYQLVTKRLHPDISRRRFRFLFLKFPKQPWQECPPLTDDQLEGYEWVLTDLQEQLEAFTLDNVGDNLAAHDEERRWLCGKDGFKKDGSPYWKCESRDPQDYWVIVDERGDIVTSALTPGELEPKLKADKGQRIEQRTYPGCIAHWKDGRRRSFQ